MFSDEEIAARILLKLAKRGKWGGAHTSIDNLKGGWNIRDLGKDGIKRLYSVAKLLTKQGFILVKPTHYGLEISLNPGMSKDITAMIKKFYPSDV